MELTQSQMTSYAPHSIYERGMVMRIKRNLFCLWLVLVFWIGIIPSSAQGVNCPAGEMRVNGDCGTAALSTLEDGWNKIDPGGETMCAHRTDFSYFVRPGETDNLLIFMQGGGGCWNADTCRDSGVNFNGFYSSRVTAENNPANRRSGILNLDDPENPFGDYTAIYIPVCTGDVHWGNNTVIYPDEDEGDVTMEFKGYVNTSSALEWVYDNITAPDSIFVTGCSAGSVGSILHTPYLIEHYPDVPVVQFGDSLSLLFNRPVDLQTDYWRAHDNFPQWIPELAEMEALDWTMARFYTAVANYYPDYIFSQFNSIRDHVQVFFTFPAGDGRAEDWSELLNQHLEEIQANTQNYRSFTSGGDLHCVTPGNTFYTYAINGIRLVDWVANLAKGIEVESLHCGDNCARAETMRRP